MPTEVASGCGCYLFLCRIVFEKRVELGAQPQDIDQPLRGFMHQLTHLPHELRCLLRGRLNRREIDKLIGLTEQQGYTLVPLAMYWKRGRAKLEVGLAKGKKQHDKRASDKDRDWQREKQRILRKG